MTKNLYHGIFLNHTGFTVYDGIFFFMHYNKYNTTNKLPIMKLVLIKKKCICTVQRWQEEHKRGL